MADSDGVRRILRTEGVTFFEKREKGNVLIVTKRATYVFNNEDKLVFVDGTGESDGRYPNGRYDFSCN